MERRVIDASALLIIQDVVKPDLYMDTLSDLDDEVDGDFLFFPSEVVKDLGRRARNETLSIWIKALASGRTLSTVPFRYNQQVTGQCPDLVDVDSVNDSPTAVAALACMLRETYPQLQVVTDDLLDKPLRMPLGRACDQMNLPHQTVVAYLTDLGLGNRLR